MVLGLRSKHRRAASLKVNFIVRVHEIRPWPPSESLRSVQTVLLQWENGNHYSGTLISAAQDSKVVFNESFKFPSLLYRDHKAHDRFQKNCLEFSLFVLRKEKVKGQLLGTSIVNLADYGVIENAVTINAVVNLKKGYGSKSVQSAIILSLELDEKDSPSSSSPNVGLSKEASLDNDNDGFEIASFTDDDSSSQSSRTGHLSTLDASTSSPSQVDKNVYRNSEFEPVPNRDALPSSNDASSGKGSRINDDNSSTRIYERSMTSVEQTSKTPVIRSSLSSLSSQVIIGKLNTGEVHIVQESDSSKSDLVVASNKPKTMRHTQQLLEETSNEGFEPEALSENNSIKNASNSDFTNSSLPPSSLEFFFPPVDVGKSEAHPGMINIDDRREIKDGRLADRIMQGKQFSDSKLNVKLSKDPIREQVAMTSHEALPPLSRGQLEHVNSIIHDPLKGNGFPPETYVGEKDISDGCSLEIAGGGKTERKDKKVELSYSTRELRTRIEMLEEELREAAATEVGLYSVVAEHASSGNKVHAPARRLARFYSNALRAGNQAKRTSAARVALSGLVVVSKSCGNDVPRLTFWLSNSIMLRSIVSHIAVDFPHSSGPQRKTDDHRPELSEMPSDKGESSGLNEEISSFIIALETVEAWLFSRIVESLWWQSFTPHMQPTVAKASDMTPTLGTDKKLGRRNSVGNQEQGNFSTVLWKKAFKDACERLCPNRAAGLECGCLSALVRLVMEQLVDRLDVAMFNAVLRETADEMPTDPLSDPICDLKVLPIPAGKSSFGAGVELKNAIGSWSRWLTDLFDLDDEPTEHSDVPRDGKGQKFFKAFRLLHSLSDLMMLPFGMLADTPTRREVCPMFGPAIIKRVLTSFVADEFCPDPVPQSIVDALDREEVSDASEEMLTSLPCTARPTKYSPPPPALLTCVGEVGRQVLQSSRLPSFKKSYTSDDELDQLDSPFTSIIPNNFQSSALTKLGLMPKEKCEANVMRYQLLREAWKDDN